MERYIQKKTAFRWFLHNRVDEYIQYIGIDRFMELDPEEIFSEYMVFVRNKLKISLLKDKQAKI